MDTNDPKHWELTLTGASMTLVLDAKDDDDEFEDEESEDVAGDEESLDVDRLMQDLDKRKRGAARGAEPAWRKLERLLEHKRTSELLSDFDDYDIGDGRKPPRKR